MNKKFIYKELIKQIFKSVGWLAILFQLVLLFTVLQPLFEHFRYYMAGNLDSITSGALIESFPGIQVLIFIIAPIILGMFLFNYLMRRSSSDFIHGLPISRKAVYFHHVISGVVLIVVPIVNTAFIAWIFVHAPGFTENAAANLHCIEWITFACSIALISFALSTIGASVSGNFIVQGIISIGILMMPFIFPVGLEEMMLRFLYGFNLLIINLSGVVWYCALILLSIVILWATSFAYRKRKVENISEPIIFSAFKPIFKMLFTLLVMFSTAIVTLHMDISNLMYVIFLLIGSFGGYVFAVFILKELRFSWKNYRAFVFYFWILIAMFVGIHLIAPTYNNAIPDVDEISEVSFSIYSVTLNTNAELMDDLLEMCTFTEPESIEAFTDLHQQYLEEMPSSFDGAHWNQFTITYKLENGREKSRTYYFAYPEVYADFIEGVINLPESKSNVCEFLDTVVREKVSDISMYIGDYNVTVMASDEEMFNGLIDAIIEDAESISSFSSRADFSEYRMTFKTETGDVFGIYLTSEYTNTIQWLEENGFEEEAAMLENS